MNKLSRLFFRLSVKEKMLFSRHMEVMINSGMPILKSLDLLKQQAKSQVFKDILDQLIMDVKNGQTISSSLSRYHNIFGDFFINLVRVGESSGTLGENLKYLTEELKKKDELQKKIKGAMVYPIIILAATLGITSILTFFIFPKILPVLENLNVPLPLVTRAFIVISNFMLAYGLWIILGSIGLLVGLWFILKVRKVKYYWHTIILRIPFVNNMVKTVNLISFARTIGLLLKSGIKIVEALQISADTLTNLVYKKRIREIAEGVRRGDPMSKYFLENANLFPITFSQMIVVGENTGKLEDSALFLADFYEGEMDEATKSLSNFVEPVLLLVMGFVVGFVALAIITPIYTITQSLGR